MFIFFGKTTNQSLLTEITIRFTIPSVCPFMFIHWKANMEPKKKRFG